MNQKLLFGVRAILVALSMVIFLALPVFAASPPVAVEADRDTGRVKVTISESDWIGSDLSFVCYDPQWGGSDLETDHVEYLNQYKLESDSQVVEFNIKKEVQKGEYFLKISSNHGSELVRFSFGDDDAEPEQVTVEYKAGVGGKIVGAASQKINQGGSTTEVTAVPDSGFQFVKWSDGKTTARRKETNVQKNLTLMAEFQKSNAPNTYTVTLDPNGGFVVPTVIRVPAGKIVGALPIPIRSQFIFKGWFTQKSMGGSAVTAGTRVNGNMVIYAQWEQASPNKGYRFTSGGLKYKVTKKAVGKKKGEAEVVGASKKKTRNVKIPETVKVGSYHYRVTSIGQKAFYNKKSLKSVVVGKNVRTIKNKAFCNCKALKTITFTRKKQTKVGKLALKNIHKKAVIKVPASKVKAYRKWLKGKGQKSTVVIKKK